MDLTKPSKLVYGYVKKAKLIVPGTSKVLEFSPIIMNDSKANLCGLDIICASGGGQIVTKSDSVDGCYVFNSEKNQHDVSTRVVSGEKVSLGPRECRFVKINCCNLEGDIIVESNKKRNNLEIIDGIVNKDTKSIKIFNSSIDKRIEVQDGQNLGYGYSCDISVKQKLGDIPDIEESQNKAKIFTTAEISSMIDKKCEHIKNIKHRTALKNILHDKIDAFDIGPKSVGKFKKQVTINPEGKNIVVKPEKRRTFNPNVAEKVNKQLDQFLDKGLIEACNFPLISPANIVAARRKGSDKIRVCLDYRRLNEELPPNFYPLPTKDELLGRFGNTTIDTCLVKIDIASRFHNFELCEQDRYLTSIFYGSWSHAVASAAVWHKICPGHSPKRDK